MHELTSILDVLKMSFAMLWEILWALILGFSLSAVVQAVVSKSEMTRLLPDDSPHSLLRASGLGAASSSCSFAAVAMARSLFRKGANFTAAMVFELASTNLVFEIIIIMVILLGWPFAAAELLGAPVMIALLAVIFRLVLTPHRIREAREQANQRAPSGVDDSSESNQTLTSGSLLKRVFSEDGKTAISYYFVADWLSLWKDIVIGLLIASAIAVWVPQGFWTGFFLASHPVLNKFWGPLIGPLVGMASFVCSVGNIPLAAVLWNNGMSFGGVIAFIFADLITIPILDIYRKSYGWKMTGIILSSFYASMVGGALAIEFLFQNLGWIPADRHAQVMECAVRFNYTTVLNVVFMAIAALLIARFIQTQGAAKLRGHSCCAKGAASQ